MTRLHRRSGLSQSWDCLYRVHMLPGQNRFVLPADAYCQTLEKAESLINNWCANRGLDLVYVGDPIPNNHLYQVSDGREFCIARNHWNRFD